MSIMTSGKRGCVICLAGVAASLIREGASPEVVLRSTVGSAINVCKREGVDVVIAAFCEKHARMQAETEAQ